MRRIYNTICFFVIVSVFIYVFSGILGVNVLKYHPVENKWLSYGIEGSPSMGYYGKIAFSLPLAIILSIGFYFVFSNRRIDAKCMKGASILSVLYGMFFFIGEEWHAWGIAKRGLDSKVFFNFELVSYLIVLGLFLVVLYLSVLVDRKEG